jgi:hypothetical protein
MEDKLTYNSIILYSYLQYLKSNYSHLNQEIILILQRNISIDIGQNNVYAAI